MAVYCCVFRSDSRIPKASLGTAEEDALRRDFTLNALFYNVNEGKVEDMTGRYGAVERTGLRTVVIYSTDMVG